MHFSHVPMDFSRTPMRFSRVSINFQKHFSNVEKTYFHNQDGNKPLLEPNSLHRRNLRDKRRRDKQKQQRDKHRAKVQQQNPRPADVDGGIGQEVRLLRQGDDVEVFLDEAEANAHYIADQQTDADDKAAVDDKYLADGGVVGAQGFHDANHVGALEDEDEQGGNHVDGRHHYHERKNDEFVHGLEVEPIEDAGILRLDGLHIEADVAQAQVGCYLL